MKTKDLSSQEVEPYDFISMEYNLWMTKENPDGNAYEYLNYLQDLKLSRFVSFSNSFSIIFYQE